MNTRRSWVWTIIAFLALVVVGYLSSELGDDPVALGPEAPGGVEPTQDRSLPPISGATEGLDRQAPPVGDERLSIESSADEQAATPEPDQAHLVGRLLLPGGRPARGAALRLHGFGANQERELEFGIPKDWLDPIAETDAAGRFDIAFDPPRAFQFSLDASLSGFAGLSWRWSSLPQAEVTDVGDQVFAPSGAIVGQVVGPDGAPAKGRWRVYADSGHRPTGAGADETRVSASADPATGAFRLEGVPPGPVQLTAYSRLSNWIDGPSLVLEAGREHSANIVYDGPDNSSRITVVTFSRPFFVFNEPEEGAIRCSDGVGGEWVAKKIEGSSQSWSFDGLPAGSYTVRIESDLHLPWSRSGVRPGQSIDAHLNGSAAIALNVRDAQSGAELVDFDLKLRFEEANFSPNVFGLRETGDEPPVGGVYTGLIPRPSTLIVEAAGYAPCEVELGELAAGETRGVRADLDRGGRISGRVLRGDGAAAPGVALLLHPHFENYDPGDIFSGPRGMSQRSAFKARTQEKQTDDRGAFAFEHLPAGDYDLRASDGAVSILREHLLVERDREESIVLELGATGSLAGALLAPEGASFEGLQVLVYPGDKSRHGSTWYHDQADVARAEIDERGRFRVDSVPAGDAVADLYIPSRMIPSGFSSAWGTQPTYSRLGLVRIESGQERRVEFDLRDRFPGTLVIEVTLNGAPAAGCVVRAEGKVDGTRVQDSGGQIDAEGRLRLSPLLAGEWSLTISSLGASWRKRVEGPVTLSSGSEVTVRAQVLTARGRVRVIDAATGEPVGGREIWLVGRGKQKTDGEGWLDLELTAGSYTLRDGVHKAWDESAPKATLHWTAAGPVQQELKLQLAEDPE